MTSLEQHVRQRQLDLAHAIASRKKIYLDLRFWIIAREVEAGQNTGAADRKLLHLLRRGVANGAFVCPISDSTFMELMKQAHTPTRRMATAALIDELSLGISILTGRARIATEVAVFFHRLFGHTNLHELDELVWTKLAYALGYVHPTISELEPELELQIQKEVFDDLWEQSLSDMIAAIGNHRLDAEEQHRSAERINADIQAHAEALKSYRQTYRHEIAGAVDLCGETVAEVFSAMAERQGYASPPASSDAWAPNVSTGKNILLATLLRKPEARQTLRSLHTHASLHAELRWNKGTKFTANHSFDFEHAAAAVGYCDAFFTEGQLAKLVHSGNTRLSELNGCRTTDDVAEAVEVLKSLLRPASTDVR